MNRVGKRERNEEDTLFLGMIVLNGCANPTAELLSEQEMGQSNDETLTAMPPQPSETEDKKAKTGSWPITERNLSSYHGRKADQYFKTYKQTATNNDPPTLGTPVRFESHP